MSRPVYPIKFPLVKEPTKQKRGPRNRLVPDKTGLDGARACAAGMIISAIHNRDWARTETNLEQARLNRAQMRSHALWARVFAGHFDADAPVVLAAEADVNRRFDALIARSNRRST